jgi:DNA recombination protein RmuC
MIIILLSIIILLLVVNIVLTLIKRKPEDLNDLKEKFVQMDVTISKVDPLIRDEFGRNREESQRSFKENREELNQSFKLLGDTLTKTVAELSNTQKGQFELFSNRQEQIRKDSEANLKEIRETVEKKLQTLQEENSKKLEEMRKVVDEKLQETVEKRFNESFKLINERLEQVHKGLGEMQSLASGVGDLKKVLTNVKTRGNLGEIQLGAILEQILSPEQYEQNAVVRENSSERVEYVIKLPGKNNDDKSLLLPVDSKFPNEDYQRLLDVYENTTDISSRDRETVAKQFENSVKKSAKDIRDKYINPPVTTDFAILFVPTEGLYAEILRRTGLFETLQRDYKITVVGPTNFVAFLSSLQMGFKTLAIEKRSSEVWEVLGAVKTQFSSFGDILEKTKKKLEQATNVIDQAGVRSRAIERKLRTVQELPNEQTVEMLGEAIEIEEDSRIEDDDNDE